MTIPPRLNSVAIKTHNVSVISGVPDVSLDLVGDVDRPYNRVAEGYKLMCNKILYWLMQKSISGMYCRVAEHDTNCYQRFHLVADFKQGAIIIQPRTPVDSTDDNYSSVVVFWTKETNVSYTDLSRKTKQTLLHSIIQHVTYSIGRGVVRSVHPSVGSRARTHRTLFGFGLTGVIEFTCAPNKLEELSSATWREFVLGDVLKQIQTQTVEEMLTGSDGYLRQVAQAIQAKA